MNTKGSIALIPLFIIVTAIGLLGAIVSTRIPTSSPSATSHPTPTSASAVRGKLVLSTDHNANIFSVGDSIDVIVAGDSGGFSITGFDVVVEYDNTMLAYEKTTHLQSGYQSFSRQSSSQASVTAIKKLEVKDPIYFQDTPLVKFQFKALKQGVAHISLKSSSSHLVDEKTKEILDAVSGIAITIGMP